MTYPAPAVQTRGTRPRGALKVAPTDRLWSAHEVIARVAAIFNLKSDALISYDRTARTSHIRQLAYYVIRTRLRHSLPEIGRVFGRDHTTILHGVQKIERLLATSPAVVRGVPTHPKHGESWRLASTVERVLSEWPVSPS